MIPTKTIELQAGRWLVEISEDGSGHRVWNVREYAPGLTPLFNRLNEEADKEKAEAIREVEADE